MIKALDITKAMKMLIIILSAIFLLTACNPNNQNEDTAALKAGTELQDETDKAHNECWQAKILELLYDALGTASTGMYKKITNGAMALMMVAFALWFSHRLLIHVSSMTEENIGEVWKEVLSKFFICFVCGYFASSPEMVLWTLNTLVFPIYIAFLEFGSEILAASQFDSAGGYNNILGSDIKFETSLVCQVPTSGTAASLDGGFPSAPKEMMSCMVCSVSERLGIGRKLAFKVLTGAGFITMIIGVIVYVVFTFVKLGFVFYLVDTIFKMAIMAVILPILIMSYAFKYTRKWTKKGFFIILHSSAFAACIAILMTTALLAMEKIFIDNRTLFFGADEDPGTQLNDLSVTFICLMLICFLLVSTIGVAGALTGSIIGEKVDPKFQKKLKVVLETIAAWLTGGVAKGAKRVASVAKAANNQRKSAKSD